MKPRDLSFEESGQIETFNAELQKLYFEICELYIIVKAEKKRRKSENSDNYYSFHAELLEHKELFEPDMNLDAVNESDHPARSLVELTLEETKSNLRITGREMLSIEQKLKKPILSILMEIS